jgi:hypothetical protein
MRQMIGMIVMIVIKKRKVRTKKINLVREKEEN